MMKIIVEKTINVNMEFLLSLKNKETPEKEKKKKLRPKDSRQYKPPGKTGRKQQTEEVGALSSFFSWAEDFYINYLCHKIGRDICYL